MNQDREMEPCPYEREKPIKACGGGGCYSDTFSQLSTVVKVWLGEDTRVRISDRHTGLNMNGLSLHVLTNYSTTSIYTNIGTKACVPLANRRWSINHNRIGNSSFFILFILFFIFFYIIMIDWEVHICWFLSWIRWQVLPSVFHYRMWSS
jgi:hypothetical protein